MSKVLEHETVTLAKKLGIPLYKARMLLYVKYRAQEARAEKIKEALKDAIIGELEHLHKHAAMTAIPDTDDRHAVAYMYDQAKPWFDEAAAKKLVTPEVLNQIYHRPVSTCFAVVPMAGKTGINLLARTEAFYKTKAEKEATLEDQLRASVEKAG